MTAGNLPTDVLPVSQVAELINGLVKALRAFHMYLPNNPIYQRATENLRIAFLPIWNATDELVLHVVETDFVWEEQVVYHQLNKSESLAWGLFKDGMRTLTIRQGALVAYHFDERSGRVDGEPLVIAQGFERGSAAGAFSASRTGVLAHRSATAQRRQLVWVTRKGEQIGTVGDAATSFMGSPGRPGPPPQCLARGCRPAPEANAPL